MLKALELFWLAISVGSFLFTIYIVSHTGFTIDTLWFSLIAVAAGTMFGLRRYQRKRMEEEE